MRQQYNVILRKNKIYILFLFTYSPSLQKETNRHSQPKNISTFAALFTKFLINTLYFRNEIIRI